MISTNPIYRGVAPNYFPWNTFLFLFAIIWSIMFVPFIVADLYFAYRDTSCVQLFAANIDLSLRTFLLVDAYVMIGFFVVIIFLGIIAILVPERLCIYVLWENTHLIFILWRLSWLVVGAIIFWAHINKTGQCDRRISRYLWADLIIGFAFLFI